MPFELSEGTLSNNEVSFDEDADGNLVMTHESSGATFLYDTDNSVWVPTEGVKSVTVEVTDDLIDPSGTSHTSELADLDDAESIGVSDSGSSILSSVSNINFNTNIDVTDDGGGSVTINATDTDTQLTTEEVEDIVGALVVSDSNLSWSYDDANNQLTISLSSSISTDSIANTDYNESTQTITSASGTTDLDLSQANVFRVEAVDNITFTFSNVTSTPSGNSITVYVVESDGAGPYTISWPSSVVWNGGTAVGEVAQNSNIEISLLTDDGGTGWRGRKSGGGFA
jgi:hypothetical protein